MAQLEQSIFNFLLAYSTEPSIVYIAIAVLMTAGSFGLPISEEIIIISAGLLAHIGSHPELYPEIAGAGQTVAIPTTALVCFLSVFLSDFLVFCTGRFLSRTIQNYTYFNRVIPKKKMIKISNWMCRYGYIYPALFRFTPGLRFPGHFSCGLFRIPFSQFIIVDGTTALLTVPTQVILVGIFGYTITKYLKESALGLAVIVFLFIIIFFIRKFKEIKHSFLEKH